MKQKSERLLQWDFPLLLVAVFFMTAFVAAQAQGKPTQALASPSGPQYAGTDTCKTCHEELYDKSFERTPHFKTTLGGGHGCESCHGPGSAHVEGGGDVSKIVSFKSLPKSDVNKRCLSCHGENLKQRHFSSSVHASSDVGCLDCHSPHKAAEPRHLLAKSEPALCYGCHLTQAADFAKPYHHRVNEGLVQCGDCHNVHGTTPLRQVKSLPSGDAVCYKCHADKQGPFVFEHVPVKTEGCNSCHTPHGSTNPRMLRVSQINLLCLQCHTFPVQGPVGPAHNQSARYQACTMCHPMIHGSNASSAFLK
jgi:DmsE family decaheme c-type cytochrome